MAQDQIKLQFFGDLTRLARSCSTLCQETRRSPKRYDGLQVNVCLNYGGRDEIVRAATGLCRRTARQGRPTRRS